MHRFVFCLVLGPIWGLFFYPAAQAQYKSPAQLRAEAEAAQGDVHREEVSVLERENAHAWQLGNSTFFQRVYGDDYLGTNEIGQLVTKSSLVQMLQTSGIQWISVVASDVHVRFFQDTAVVQTLWSMRGTRNGQSIARQLRVIHVYIDGPGGWKVVAGQQTLLPGQ